LAYSSNKLQWIIENGQLISRMMTRSWRQLLLLWLLLYWSSSLHFEFSTKVDSMIF
jgi:hypothetical protein